MRTELGSLQAAPAAGGKLALTISSNVGTVYDVIVDAERVKPSWPHLALTEEIERQKKK